MAFLKNHFEKVLLSLVLLAVAVVMALLPMKVPVSPPDAATSSTNAPAAYNGSTNEAALLVVEQLKVLDFSWPHNLFNPVIWQRMPDRSLRKITSPNQLGLGAVRVDKIIPLHLIISLEGFNPPKYQLGVIQETNQNTVMRNKILTYAAIGDKTDTYKLMAANPAAPEPPTEVTLELNDGRTVTVSKEKTLKAVVGYAADLSYPAPTGIKFFPGRRAGEAQLGIIMLEPGETNKVVDIRSNEVVVSSSSGKRVTLKYNAAP